MQYAFAKQYTEWEVYRVGYSPFISLAVNNLLSRHHVSKAHARITLYTHALVQDQDQHQ